MSLLAELFSLTNRVAFVTGASRGLGRAIAGGLARAGAHVVLCGRDAAALASACAELAAAGLAAGSQRFDVGDEAAAAAAIAATVATHGRLDILVNCAGLTRRHRFETLPTADWRAVMDANLEAAFYLSRAALPTMLAGGYGRIVNVASVAATIARPTIAPYVVSKHALVGLTRALAVEFGGRGVTVNAIAPGYFKTDLTRALADDAAFDGWLRARTPAGRWGEPEELVGAAVFLASPAMSYVNGHVLTVDGGMSAAM